MTLKFRFLKPPTADLFGLWKELQDGLLAPLRSDFEMICDMKKNYDWWFEASWKNMKVKCSSSHVKNFENRSYVNKTVTKPPTRYTVHIHVCNCSYQILSTGQNRKSSWQQDRHWDVKSSASKPPSFSLKPPGHSC